MEESQQPQMGAQHLKKMMIVVSKSGIDGVYAGLIMANGARSEGIEVDMFFTFFGIDAITKNRREYWYAYARNGWRVPRNGKSSNTYDDERNGQT